MQGPTQVFYGDLTEWRDDNEAINMRFSTRWCESEAFRAEVLIVRARRLRNHNEVLSLLRSLELPARNASLPQDSSTRPYEVTFGDDSTLPLEGGELTTELQPFKSSDYLRVISDLGGRLNASHEEVTQLWQKQSAIRRICADQISRLNAKSGGHAVQSTARTLYDQQIAFIQRIIDLPTDDA